MTMHATARALIDWVTASRSQSERLYEFADDPIRSYVTIVLLEYRPIQYRYSI